MISRTVTVINRLGLHARAATRLVNCAADFESEVLVSKGPRVVNGKSIMGVLTLAAATGTELTIEAQGTDEKMAVDALIRLINNRFGEDE
ncbi:MAG: HPr family phosphocarrier protein [Xanthomonadales bacterium]|nr:HPr family phosphocarrier protein [Gammaproteobacteria bacterium]MBT8053066.1 HPr family phosphocarrier protein [Gammaproteobacteria bacterium]NND56690.1 HPr family phosphocarrier protein [Xanthomonadales bacterium]NNK52675.1 HPr family phosphocarrier protein [Xanthomonadales bacterium]